MKHQLTNTAACKLADRMAFELAALGDGAKITEMRRRAFDSYDLLYVVVSTSGERKEVIVTNAALSCRVKAEDTQHQEA